MGSSKVLGRVGNGLWVLGIPCHGLVLYRTLFLGPPSQPLCFKIYSVQPYLWMIKELGFSWGLPGQSIRLSRAEPQVPAEAVRVMLNNSKKASNKAVKPVRQMPFILLRRPSPEHAVSSDGLLVPQSHFQGLELSLFSSQSKLLRRILHGKEPTTFFFSS